MQEALKRRRAWVNYEVEPPYEYSNFEFKKTYEGGAKERAIRFIKANEEDYRNIRLCKGTIGPAGDAHWWIEIGQDDDLVIYDGETARFYLGWLLYRNANFVCEESYSVSEVMDLTA